MEKRIVLVEDDPDFREVFTQGVGRS